MMHGDVDSEPGRGGTFWFTARLGKADVQTGALVPKPDLRGRRVPVVDDNEVAERCSKNCWST
jgi:two-component system sensor histidine kinase/response regulator